MKTFFDSMPLRGGRGGGSDTDSDNDGGGSSTDNNLSVLGAAGRSGWQSGQGKVVLLIAILMFA